MRAADHQIAAPTTTAFSTTDLVKRLALACAMVLLLLWFWSPAIVHAQGTAQQQDTQGYYTVQKRPGESLHDIAVRFYRDSTRWREISTANALNSANSRQLVEAGKRLRLPGRTAAQVAATLRAPATTPATTRPASSLAAQTAGRGNADSAQAAAARKAPPATASTKPRTNTTGTNRARTSGTTTRPTVVAARDSTTRAANDSAAARAAVDERPMERVGLKVGIVDPDEARAARGKDQPTVFMGRVSESEAAVRQAVAAAQQTRNVIAPRHGEYAAAPFPLEEARLSNAGKVVRRLNGTGGVDPDLPRNVSLADEAVVILPGGATAVVGQRYAAVHRGPVLANGARVVVPTGVFEIVRADAGQPIVARVMRQSGIIEEGQSLVAFEGTATPADVKSTVVTNDQLRGTVSFVMGDQLIPSLQTYLVLDASQAQGVQQGDEFWLIERIGLGDDARERRIAVVRIVRTSPHGSTGIVIHQDRPGIAVGAAVRRVARAGTGAGD